MYALALGWMEQRLRGFSVNTVFSGTGWEQFQCVQHDYKIPEIYITMALDAKKKLSVNTYVTLAGVSGCIEF